MQTPTAFKHSKKVYNDYPYFTDGEAVKKKLRHRAVKQLDLCHTGRQKWDGELN